MSTKKTQHSVDNDVSDEEAEEEREHVQSEIIRIFKGEWGQEKPIFERARVMLKSNCASNSNVSELHMFTAQLLMAEKYEWPKLPHLDYERAILTHFIKLMTAADAPKRLKMLAELTKRFPVSQRGPNFNNWRSGPDWFKPTLQNGLKSVMLGAYFDLMKDRPSKTTLPTIGELDSVIREKWKWSGGDRELRLARSELGLNGLPHGESGRPKKQRGRK